MHIFLEESNTNNPYENLAMEVALADYVSKCQSLGQDIYGLFLWQSENAIVFGRNQCIKKECRLDLADDNHVSLVRRNSGGGAVYHDLGNLNFTFISKDSNDAKDNNNEIVIAALKKLGIEAEVSGRNDILVDGRKFSGNAYTRQNDLLIHHGTIMVDLNTALANELLSPKKSKLKSKGIESVRSRVINLKQVNEDITLSSVKKELAQTFINKHSDFETIKPDINIDVYNKELNKLTSQEWIRRDADNNGIEVSGDLGSITFSIKENDGKIVKILYESDILEVELLQLFMECLEGTSLDEDALTDSLNSFKNSLGKPLTDSWDFMLNRIIVGIINSFDN